MTESRLDLRLHARQTEAFESPAREILFGGQAGGGKSHFLRVLAVTFCYAIPGLQVYLFRRTFPELWANHMQGAGSFPELLGPWLEAGHAEINHSRNTIRVGSSQINLCYSQREADVERYRGADIHLLLVDELTHFTGFQYRFLRSRLRLGGLPVPERWRDVFPRIVSGSNPGGPGHNFVKATFIDPAPPMTVWQAPPDEGGLSRQFIPSRLSDNPSMDADYADRLRGLGDPMLVRAMLEGDWTIVAGGMFDDVWTTAQHAAVLRPFPIPRGWRLDRSFDWGSSKPFSVGWWAESDGTEATLADGTRRSFPRGSLFRIAEWYGWNGKPDEGSKMLARDIARGILERERDLRAAKRIAEGARILAGPADSAIFDVQNGQSIADDMRAEGVLWERSDKGPGSRRNGWERLRTLLAATTVHPMESPGLFVFDNCRAGFLRTVPTLPRSERDRDDVDTAAEDHVGDEVRYRIGFKRASRSVEDMRA